jgi:superfamily I DNA and/or RNA helicase
MTDSLHFNISFPKTLPSYYDIQLNADHINWKIYYPPAKNRYDAGENLVDLSKSITLQGMDNSKLRFGSLLLANGDNMNYTDFYNFIFTSNTSLKNRFREWQYCLIEKLQ